MRNLNKCILCDRIGDIIISKNWRGTGKVVVCNEHIVAIQQCIFMSSIAVDELSREFRKQ